MTMWEIASRKIPFEEIAKSEVIGKISKGEREVIPTDCPEQYKQSIEECWKIDPTQRISLEVLKQKLVQGSKTLQEIQLTSTQEKPKNQEESKVEVKPSNELKKDKLQYQDGSIYEGDIVNGKREGKGMLFLANGDIYIGDWHEDQYHGYGAFKYKSGEKYQGHFNEGKREGKGTCKYANQDTYEGEWKNDQKNGYGIYVCAQGPSTGDMYQGN